MGMAVQGAAPWGGGVCVQTALGPLLWGISSIVWGWEEQGICTVLAWGCRNAPG